MFSFNNVSTNSWEEHIGETKPFAIDKKVVYQAWLVYCKDGLRCEEHEHTKFDFLGYEFRPRLAKNHSTGQFFVGFTPAVSPTAKKAMKQAFGKL